MFKELFLYRKPLGKYNFDITEKHNDDTVVESMDLVSTEIRKNLEYVKEIFSYGKSGDIVIREFDVNVEGRILKSFLVCVDGLVGSADINENILMPLMYLSDFKKRDGEVNEDYIYRRLMPHCQISKMDKSMTF